MKTAEESAIKQQYKRNVNMRKNLKKVVVNIELRLKRISNV